MASYTFTVTYEVSRESGKFAGRDEIVAALHEALESVEPDLDGLGADGESVYVVDDVSVEEQMTRRARG